MVTPLNPEKSPPTYPSQIDSKPNENDLDALEISLSKGDSVKSTDKPALKNLIDSIAKAKQNLTYKNLLKDHPDWKPVVNAWPATIEEKIWLMRIHELAIFDIAIPGMLDGLYPAFASNLQLHPLKNSIELLKNRDEITKKLEEITAISWGGPQLTKCPNAICLLVNLKQLSLSKSKITEPPNLRLNKNLEHLDISNCINLTNPPDLRMNENLRSLNLTENSLNKSPNLNKNLKLEKLQLSGNKLTIAPDIRMLKNLKSLELSRNQIEQPPDLSQNLELKDFFMGECGTKKAPDITQNKKLERFFFYENSLSGRR